MSLTPCFRLFSTDTHSAGVLCLQVYLLLLSNALLVSIILSNFLYLFIDLVIIGLLASAFRHSNTGGSDYLNG